ncbi:hypothetical protein FACS1894110_18390 [Spirochaetia bacterium]|nr:hypothetical protein FACS1894110_18390 [Spirochaetia bacterium]
MKCPVCDSALEKIEPDSFLKEVMKGDMRIHSSEVKQALLKKMCHICGKAATHFCYQCAACFCEKHGEKQP